MCILGDQMLCLRYCFALCKINLFSVKPLWGFILVSSETMFWLLSFSEKQYVFDCVVVGNIWEVESCRLSFLYRESRRFSNNTLQRLWLNLVKLQLFINQKCSTVKGDSADWACAMPRNQSVCRVGLPLQDWKSLSNCVDLKETLVSLKQFKVSDEMSRNLFEIPTNVIC